MGIGDWGLGVWAKTPNPKTQTPKPNTQNPKIEYKKKFLGEKKNNKNYFY